MLVGGCVDVAIRACLAQCRGEVGGLVLGRIRPEARGRRDVDRRGCLCHVSQVGMVWRGAARKQRKAAVARVFEQKVGLELQVARNGLVRLAMPGKAERVVLAEAGREGVGDGVLNRRADGRGLCGRFAPSVAGEGRVAEGWWRRRIQLHGGRGVG